jgi:hypothetical protein
MFHNILAKHDKCVLQVIWINKCLQNYMLFWHNCEVTCQLNVSQYKKCLQLTIIIMIILNAKLHGSVKVFQQSTAALFMASSD